MMKRTAITAALAAASLAASAGGGTTSYNFLNIPTSTRVYGLGGVNVSAIATDISMTEQNPALLGAEVDGQFLFNYMHYIGAADFAGARFGMGVANRGAWSAAIQYFGYGEIPGADADGTINGSFYPNDICFSGTYSHDINERLRGGITLKGICSTYERYSAFALATDLGLNYYDEERDLSLSLVITNLGGQVKRFTDHYDHLPSDIRLGFSKGLGETPITLSVTAWNLTHWHLPYQDLGDGSATSEEQTRDTFTSNLFRHLVIGAEYSPSERFYLGLGYNYKTRTDMSAYSRSFISGFSICGGLNVGRFGVGAAFAQPHKGATTFMVNFNIQITELK